MNRPARALLFAAATALAADEPDALRLDGLSPALAEALREARGQARQAAATAEDAEARADAWGRLGMFYQAQHLPFAAERAYDRALAAADRPRWRYLRALVRQERGDHAQAVADYRQAAAGAPDNAAVWIRLGASLLAQGDEREADAALKRAARLRPNAAIVKVALADLAIARGEWPAARKLLEDAWQREPAAGRIAYKLAMLHRRMGDVQEAARWLERRGDGAAPKIDDPWLLQVAELSRSAGFFVKASEWALERGDHDAALAALETALGLAPQDADAQLRYAHALALSGRRERAEKAVRRVLAEGGQSARSWALMAWILRGDAAQANAAEAAARRSLALADEAPTRALAAALAMRAGRYAAAAADYAALASRHPDAARYRFWLAMARLASGDCAALGDLRRALALRGAWGEAHVALARAEALCGEPESALRRARALREAKDDAETRLTLALAELAAGNAARARALADSAPAHPYAALLRRALAGETLPERAFAAGSSWWLPPELE